MKTPSPLDVAAGEDARTPGKEPRSSTRTHLEGHLNLVGVSDETGRSFFSRQSFSAPFHLSKPYTEHEVLVAQIVNPTAGLLAGDRLRSEVRVESGARLHLTSPSASRVHTMTEGEACVVQEFHVADGAWLDYFPSPLIPQRNSRYAQSTYIQIEAGAELFFCETLAPGRVAHGECFAFTDLSWEFNLRLQRKLLARERFRLRPDDLSLLPLRSLHPTAYYVSAWLWTHRVSPQSSAWEQINQLASDQVTVGASQVTDGLWSIKLIAADSVAVTKALHALRARLAAEIPELRCVARRT